jgi:hypothetical protein
MRWSLAAGNNTSAFKRVRVGVDERLHVEYSPEAPPLIESISCLLSVFCVIPPVAIVAGLDEPMPGKHDDCHVHDFSVGTVLPAITRAALSFHPGNVFFRRSTM